MIERKSDRVGESYKQIEQEGKRNKREMEIKRKKQKWRGRQ